VCGINPKIGTRLTLRLLRPAYAPIPWLPLDGISKGNLRQRLGTISEGNQPVSWSLEGDYGTFSRDTCRTRWRVEAGHGH
jgi:hypothetical protein